MSGMRFWKKVASLGMKVEFACHADRPGRDWNGMLDSKWMLGLGTKAK